LSFPYPMSARLNLRWRKPSHRDPGLAPLVPALTLVVAIVGCSHVGKVVGQISLISRAPKSIELRVGIDSAANGNSPVALDLVLIQDQDFWKAAPAMSAKDWFAQKKDLARRYGKKIEVSSWEWAPGQEVEPIPVKLSRKFAGAMIFANYSTPGSHSAPIPLGGDVVIFLKPDDFILSSGQ
jgi:type VI secretion system protein